MFNFEEKYYKHVKICLKIYGLWFDQNIYQRLAGLIVWYIVNSTIIVPMVAIILKEYRNITILVDAILMILLYTGFCIKYTIAFLSVTKMKTLYSKISLDWQNITENSERAILERYSNQTLQSVKYYTIYCFVLCIICSSRSFLPLMVNVIAPLENGKRPQAVPYYSDYIFFDQNDYLSWVIAYVFFYHLFLFCPVVTGLDALYMQTVSHTSGLFAIICHRIEKTLDIQDQDAHELSTESEILQKLKEAIELHNETISSIRLLEDSFSNCFFAVIAMSIVGLGLGGTYVINVVNDGCELFRYIALGFGLVFHLFLINWVGQQLIDNSEEVFNSAYFSKWYLMSPRIRRYVFLIMIRSYNPSVLTAGKLINISMESFGMIMRNAASYFTNCLRDVRPIFIVKTALENSTAIDSTANLSFFSKLS